MRERDGRVRVLVDGVSADVLAEALVLRLQSLGRAAVRVRAVDFWRPAGERYEDGREDAEALRTRWLDVEALRREVLDSATAEPASYLPALRDAVTDRSARRVQVALPAEAVVVVDGCFLLGRDLPAELTVHVTLSPAALLRRGVPAWQIVAFAEYARLQRPGEHCDVLVRAEDPARPAVRIRASVIAHRASR